MKTVNTDKAPAAIGPYSQAIISGGLVFTSGQIPVDPATGKMEKRSLNKPNRLWQTCRSFWLLQEPHRKEQ